MPRRQLPHQTPRPRPFARRERITGQGTAGLIRPTLLLSIMTVDKTLVRNYDEYLARAMQGTGHQVRYPFTVAAGRLVRAASTMQQALRQVCGYIEMESFIGTI
jgi:hypothetical protein